MPDPIDVLIDYICALEPQAHALEAGDLRRLATMLWQCCQPHRSHRTRPDMFSFSTKDVRLIWGRDVRMREVINYRYFTVLQGNSYAKVTSAFAPSLPLAEALVQTLQHVESWDPEAVVAPALPKAIASMAADRKRGGRGNRQSKWKGCTPSAATPVSVQGLKTYRLNLLAVAASTDMVSAARVWIRRQMLWINWLLLRINKAGAAAAIPIRYDEATTGRIYASGTSLQNAPREVRAAALAGAWDYDIAVCQWTILIQIARRLGIGCPLVEAYVGDKSAARARLAHSARISLDLAKQCYAAVLFGAQVQTSQKAMRTYESELTTRLGMEAALRVSTAAEFMAVVDELSRVGRAVLDAWPRKQGRIVNDLGIAYHDATDEAGRDKPFNPRTALAHLLQGAEAALLRAVVRSEKENVLLCLHDGWVTREPVPAATLQDLILRDTHYGVTVEARKLKTLLKRYKYPPDRQEEATETVLRQAESLSAEWAVG